MTETTAPVVGAAIPRKYAGSVAISAQVDQILASMPADGRLAVIDVGADKDGIKAVVAANLGHGWTVAGELDRRFSGEWSGHAQLRWAGK